MGQNRSNGYPEKVELQLDQQVQLRIIRPVKIGTNGNGKDPYYLYRVVDVQSGEEKSLFAEPSIHSIIEEKHLGIGSEFLLKRVQNGAKGSSKLELSILGKAPEHQEPSEDNLREIMEKCLKEAVEITKAVTGIPFQNEDVRAICSCLFIARTRG
jgi:hypothetical protein